MRRVQSVVYLESLKAADEKNIMDLLGSDFQIKTSVALKDFESIDIIISGSGLFIDNTSDLESFKNTMFFQINYGGKLSSRAAGFFSLPIDLDVVRMTIKSLSPQSKNKALKNERANLRELFRQTPEMVCILKGPDHVFEFVNDAHVKVLGFDATGMSVREAQPESIEVYKLLDNVYNTGETARLHEIPVTVGDRLRYFNLTYSARRCSEGNINGIMILGTEITEQFLTREMLKSQSEALQMTINGRPLKEVLEVLARAIDRHLSRGVFSSILLMDYDGIHLRHGAAPSLSSAYNELIDGLEVGPSVGSCGTAAFTKKEVAVHDIATSSLWNGFHDLAKQHGLTSCWSTPLIDSSGSVIGTFALYNRPPIDPNIQELQVLNLIRQTISLIIERDRDIHKRIQTERALIESEKLYHSSEEQLAMAVDVAKIGFYDWNIPENKVTFSKQMLKDWGVKGELVTLEQALNYIHEDDRDKVRNMILATMETDAVYHTIYRVIGDEGQCEWMEVRGEVQRNKKGSPIRFFGTSLVVTEQQRREAFLERAQVNAENANIAKGIFLANMSHEIRTPLGAIMGFLNLLKNPSNTRRELNEYIGIIERSSKQLLHIVNDVLDLSKIEAGKFSIDPVDFSLVELLNDFNSLMAFKSREKGLTYQMILNSSIPDFLNGDQVRLRQILSNLVGNAIKFTERGHIKLHLTFTEDKKINIEVEDTGCGISKAAQEKIFEPFSQGDNSTTRLYGGTGLGLHLTKRLCEAMGGGFYLKESTVGVGTTFSVCLPFETLNNSKMIDSLKIPINAEVNISSRENTLKNLNVLIIDDAPENQRLLKILLESWGATTAVASNGYEAVKEALKGGFDLLLMDIQMPVMDGHEATVLLRKKGLDIPIIALTAHAMKEEEERCIVSGFTDFLTKPVDQDELFNTLTLIRT